MFSRVQKMRRLPPPPPSQGVLYLINRPLSTELSSGFRIPEGSQSQLQNTGAQLNPDSYTVLAESGSASYVFNDKNLQKKPFFGQKKCNSKSARHIFLNSKLLENPRVNRRTLHSMKFLLFYFWVETILACLNPHPGQVSQLNPDSIRLRIRKSIYRKKKKSNDVVCLLKLVGYYFVPYQDQGFKSRSVSGSALICVAGSGSAFKGWIRIRIQEGKNDPQKQKKVQNFHVFKYWMFSFEV